MKTFLDFDEIDSIETYSCIKDCAFILAFGTYGKNGRVIYSTQGFRKLTSNRGDLLPCRKYENPEEAVVHSRGTGRTLFENALEP